jgi:hypothetical protein
MPDVIPRCEVVPLFGHQVSLRIDGRERTRWCFGDDYPRPCFMPLLGPGSRTSLTRMGHPGAPNHDHHQSVWFAHNKLLGIDFWANGGDARIRQTEWLVYGDGNEQAAMAVRLGWFDGHDPQPLVEQELIAAIRPAMNGYTLDLQSAFTPLADAIEFQQSNFGFLAVRVARSISAHFGGGGLTSSESAQGESQIFGKQARWVDYSGPVRSALNGRFTMTEGVTYFDHPANPGYPNHWHVRDDGWMGCSPCMHTPLVAKKDEPLRLRFLLHAHRGPLDQDVAAQIADDWAKLPGQRVQKSTKPHHQYELVVG